MPTGEHFCISSHFKFNSSCLNFFFAIWSQKIINFYIFSVLLIVCADGIDHENLVLLLDVVFSAMVIRVGLTELKEPKNLERLKREIKVITLISLELNRKLINVIVLQNIYPLIDRILDSVHENDKNGHPTDIIGMLECALYEENQVLQVRIILNFKSIED